MLKLVFANIIGLRFWDLRIPETTTYFNVPLSLLEFANLNIEYNYENRN